MKSRRHLEKAIIAGMLLLLPVAMSAQASDYVEYISIDGATMYLDRETVDFPLNPDWKIVKIKLHMDDMKDSIQSYIVDAKNNRSALIEINNKKIPVTEWYWFVGAPNESF